jgi:hypothetical protein
MAFRSDIPPSRTIDPINPPPDSPRPTAAQLKADIDSGRTGDKNEVFDPGLSALGTDDEAAGTPPDAERVAIARWDESIARWSGGAHPEGYAHHHSRRAAYGFAGLIVLLAALFAGALWT